MNPVSQEVWETQRVVPRVPGDLWAQRAAYQQLRGAENIQSEGLDAGIMHTQLPMDARALDARQDAKVGGEPRGICSGSGAGLSGMPSLQRCCDPHEP